MCIYEKTKMIYCTDNVLFALDLFKKEGDQKRFSELLNTVETSIPIINKNHIPDKAMQVMCEIQEYKFIKMRKRWKIRNQFDQYLEAIAEDHIKSINAFISEMTRYSDYRVLAAEIELVMEYIWQTEQWEAGDKICSDLIELLRSADIYSDDIVKKSIENEIRRIEKCSLLFDLIKGKKTLKFEDASYIISSFDLPPEYKTIYRAAGALQDSGDERVIRELVLDANRLELETY